MVMMQIKKLCVYLHCTHMLASCHILKTQVIEGEKTLLFAIRLAWIIVEGQENLQMAQICSLVAIFDT